MFNSSKKPKTYLPSDVDPEALLRGHEEEIEALIEAVLAGDANVDVLIAEAVEGQQELVRIAMVEKIRAAVRARSEERAKALDAALTEHKLLEHHRQKRVMQAWLAYFMSEETLRKLRESLMASPTMKREVEQVGEELAKKGVLQQLQPKDRSDLGSLSANVQQTKEARQAKEQAQKEL